MLCSPTTRKRAELIGSLAIGKCIRIVSDCILWGALHTFSIWDALWPWLSTQVPLWSCLVRCSYGSSGAYRYKRILDPASKLWTSVWKHQQFCGLSLFPISTGLPVVASWIQIYRTNHRYVPTKHWGCSNHLRYQCPSFEVSMSSQVNLFLRGCTCTNHFFAKFQGAPQADVCRPEHRWTMVVWIWGLLRSMSNTPGAIYSMSYDICYGCTTVFQKKPKYHADLVMSLEMLHSSLEVFFAGFETQLAFGRRPLEKTGRCGFLRPLNHFQDATCMILLFWLKRTLF